MHGPPEVDAPGSARGAAATIRDEVGKYILDGEGAEGFRRFGFEVHRPRDDLKALDIIYSIRFFRIFSELFLARSRRVGHIG